MESTRKIYLIRHGETEWSLSGQHTGITDIPLTKNGEVQAKALGKRLEGHPFGAILTSPLKRALHTCEIAGLLKQAKQDPDLVEWNYGDYEGLKSEQIWKKEPGWTIFKNGAPHGESVADVEARAKKVLAKIASLKGDIALFSHGHFLRVLTVCWLNLPASKGCSFALTAGSLSILGMERGSPALELWNDTCHFLKNRYPNR